MSDPIGGVWAMKNGDFQPANFASTGAGIQAAIDYCSAGGAVFIGPGQYVTTQRLDLDYSNLTVYGAGRETEILFQPVSVASQNDRAVRIHNGDGFSARRNLSVVPLVGHTSLTASSAGDTADLVAGDWLMIEEEDNGSGGLAEAEIVLIDYVQVSSVAGTTINLYHPMRMDFLGTHSTVTFRRITTLLQNVTLRDLYIRTTDATNNLLGVGVGVAHNVLIENVQSDPTKGNPISTYRTWGLTVRNCQFLKQQSQASEFAATVDLNLNGNVFRAEDVAPTTAACTLDFGTAFFSVHGNRFPSGKNAMFQMLYGVHDGAVTGNVLGYTYSTTAGEGISGVGVQRVSVVGNVLMGGAATSDGIGFSHATILTPDYNSSGNVVMGNIVNGYVANYGTGIPTASAAIIEKGGYPVVLGYFGVGGTAFTPTTGCHLKDTTLAAIAVRHEQAGVNNWYIGPHTGGKYRCWFNSYDDTGMMWEQDQNGNFTTLAKITPGTRFVNRTALTFSDTDATPTVANGNLFKSANTVPTTITMFDDGASGQEITIIFTDANTTLTDGGNLKLNGGFTSTADDVMKLVFDGTNWYEISRSVN